MNRILRRPMFRMGGTPNEGIMTGLKEPRLGYRTGKGPGLEDIIAGQKLQQDTIISEPYIKGQFDEFIKDTNVNNKLAIDAAMFWHATRVLGREILSSLETQHGDVIPVGEGIVIRGMRPTPRASIVYPVFKIAGDFIVGGLQSSFK